MSVTTDTRNAALEQLATAAGELQEAAAAAARQLAADTEREDDIALASVIGERKRSLADEDLVDFDEMARRVDVDLTTLP